MIIKNEYINSDTALFEGKFKRHSSWITVSEEAGVWLKETIEGIFPSFSLYFFISDAMPVENSKLNKYRGLLNRKNMKENKFHDFKIISNDSEEEKNGIIFYSLLEVDISSISNVINYCRSERESFMFLSKSNNLSNFPSKEIIKRRKINKYENIDSKNLIHFLVEKNFIPIRVWGNFDDIFLYCEVYGDIEGVSTY